MRYKRPPRRPRPLFGRARPRNRKKRYRGVKTVFFASLIVFIIIYLLAQFDKKILPPVLAAANMKMKTEMNMAINNALRKIMDENRATAEDFFTRHVGNDGKVTSISVNTVLVNEVCSAAAVSVSQELSSLRGEKIAVPIGAVLGIDSFANSGPYYRFTVLPIGDATVDYGSSLSAAGINQTLFEVTITVEATVQIVNPLQSSEVRVTRQIPLVSAVLSEDVPSSYWTTKNPLD